MTWTCAAIDHGVTIFPHGKIGPCCMIAADYLKPISELNNPDRFKDLKTEYAPSACEHCIAKEDQGVNSYRKMFNALNNAKDGLQFVDIRNTNLCNLKCRYCGPHFSSQWAQELLYPVSIQHQDIDQYKNILITDSLHWMYFTGGEPLINLEHWDMLEHLIHTGKSKNIKLMYNTNLTTIRYKNKNIIDIWKQFKTVTINCSIDAIGKPLEYIRSGTIWNRIQFNIEQITKITKNSTIEIVLAPVVNILNIWFLSDLVDYAIGNSIPVNLNVLQGPDYLALNVIPDQLKPQALLEVKKLQNKISSEEIDQLTRMIEKNINQCLFSQTLNHILLLDNIRNEKLFELLPFKKIAMDSVLKNHEYE
jgi:sulfatase maturation enzyme AslB (radical SAM superfamily)